MQIAKHKVAIISYSLKDDEGTLIDEASSDDPFAFIHGTGGIIPGLEDALEGKASGDSINVTIAPEQGYGQRDDSLSQTVKKEMFEGVDELKPGMQFHAETNQGMNVVTITAIEGDDVTIDGNHPLAGITLTFDVNVIDVRDASAEELEHGHAHGTGGHQH